MAEMNVWSKNDRIQVVYMSPTMSVKEQREKNGLSRMKQRFLASEVG